MTSPITSPPRLLTATYLIVLVSMAATFGRLVDAVTAAALPAAVTATAAPTALLLLAGFVYAFARASTWRRAG